MNLLRAKPRVNPGVILRHLLPVLHRAVLCAILFALLSCDGFSPESPQSFPQGSVKRPMFPGASGSSNGGNEGDSPGIIRWTGNEGTWYQIFTIAFYDSYDSINKRPGHDGMGDLPGIIEKLDYLSCLPKDCVFNANNKTDCNKSLHIKGLWLTPIMPAPSYHKYDTKDYMDIDPQFGTMEHMKELVQKCHERGIKIIVDLAVNHSSHLHRWFAEAVEEWRNETVVRYGAYYSIRLDSSPDAAGGFWHRVDAVQKEDGTRYDPVTKNGKYMYYDGGYFGAHMPDLNWNNPLLQEEFEAIMKFWLLEIDIDGFRLDASKHIFEDNNNKNVSYWTWFANTARKYKPYAYMVGENLSDEGSILYYHKPGMSSFALGMANDYGRIAAATLMNVNDSEQKQRGRKFAEGVLWYTREIKNLHPLATFSPFLTNHDFDRSSQWLTRTPQRKMAASLLLLCPGTPFMYYGDELGIIGYKVPDDRMVRGPMLFTKDAVGNGKPDPMKYCEWSDGWGGQGIPMDDRYGFGVDEQRGNDGSLLRHYMWVQNMKNRYPWIAWGRTDDNGIQTDDDGQIAAYRVTDDNPKSATYGKSVIIAHNTSEQPRNAERDYGYLKIPRIEGVSRKECYEKVSSWETPPETPVGYDEALDAYWLAPYTTVIFREYN